MERVQMCRMCLVEDAPMYVVNRKMHEIYEKLTNKRFVTDDRRPVLVCYFCCSRLKQCCRFQRQCLEAEELFAQMLDEDYERNASIKPELGFYKRFIKTPVELISIVGDCQTESHVVKEELPADYTKLADNIESKEELQVDELEMENPGFSDVHDLPVHHSEMEYEVSLTVVKTEVEEESDTNWAPVAEESKLHIRRPKLEDVITEEQENEQSDSKIMWTNSAKRIPQFKEPLMYTKFRADNTIVNSSSVINTYSDKNLCNTSDIGKDDIRFKMSCDVNDSDDINRYRRLCDKEKPYKCEFCQYSCIQKSNLKRHLRVHTGEKPYKCDVCHYSCNDKSDLNKHTLIHTDEKPFKCDICQHVFSRKGPLNNHMRIHSGKKPYKCEVCQHAFNQKGDLINHIRIHTNEKPYKCEVCQYRCSQKSALTRHNLTHTNEKPYKCEECQYSCNQKVHIIKHMCRKHTGKIPLQCDICPRSFYTKYLLQRHLLVHTGEKPYKCEVCQYSCNQKGILKNHIRKHHSGEKP